MGNKKSRPKLKEEDVQFLIAQTSFTRKQIKQWYKGYLRDCPNGMLTREKFMEVYAEFFPSGNAKKFCEHVFRTFDSDNSGQIDFREFLLAINITSSTDPREKLNWAFSMYDIDGNGTIDKSEMTEIISTIYSMVGDTVEIQRDDTPAKRTEEIFLKMDTNKDNVLTKKEFVEGCLAEPTIRQMLLAETAQQPV